MNSAAIDAAKEAALGHLKKRLALCTEKQQAFFWKVYPNGPATFEKVAQAESLIERTIRKNEADPSRLTQ
jgi:hypothetical protein